MQTGGKLLGKGTDVGLFDGVKQRFGIGQAPGWQDEGAYEGYDEYGEAPMDGYAYDDGGMADGGYIDEPVGDVVSFDAYDPNTFKNVSFDSAYEPQVAPLDSYSSRPRGYAAQVGTSSSRSSSYGSYRSSYGSDNIEGATWATPSDPAFLDDRTPNTMTGRDVLDQIGATRVDSAAGDPYSQFDSDVRRIHRDPGARLEIVKPKVYSDVEKIATAAKAGKTVVLTLAGTKSELAKRILDFSFGVASALNKNVDKADEKVFVISKGTEMLSVDEREYLVKKGVLK